MNEATEAIAAHDRTVTSLASGNDAGSPPDL